MCSWPTFRDTILFKDLQNKLLELYICCVTGSKVRGCKIPHYKLLKWSRASSRVCVTHLGHISLDIVLPLVKTIPET